MFRIVQFKIPYEQLDALIESKPDATGRFRQWCGDLARVDDFYTSLPMSTTSAQFFVAEQYLRSLVGDPPNLIDNVTERFALFRTRAPKSYDYDYVIEIGRMDGEFGEERLVAIPRRSFDYQIGRYASGLYNTVVCT